jgi:hypothetical protein
MNFHVDDLSGAVSYHRPFGNSFQCIWFNTEADQWGQFALDLRLRGINIKLRCG